MGAGADSGRSRGAELGAAVLVVVLAGGLALTVLAGGAIAGDAVALFEFGESEHTASVDETVEIDVWLRSDGGYAGEGIETVEFVVAVSPEVGEPVEAEPGPWLAGDGGEVDQTTEDAGPGAIRIRQERVGAEDGVTGADRLATVTVAVEDDAPAADATVLLADPDAELASGDFPMRSFGDDATLVVDGGGEVVEPAYEPGDAGDGSVPITTAEDVNRTVRVDGGSAGEDSDGSAGGDRANETASEDGNALPGFGGGAAVLALLAGVAVAGRWGLGR